MRKNSKKKRRLETKPYSIKRLREEHCMKVALELAKKVDVDMRTLRGD